MQHHVADGMSGLHCVNTWSEMARGIPLKVKPFIDRTLLKANSPPRPMFPHIEYQPPPRLMKPENSKSNGNGHSNGHSNGLANGHANVHANGLANGHANGHSKGHANNYSNGHHTNGMEVTNGAFHTNGNGNGVVNDSHVANRKSNGAHMENGNGNGNGDFNENHEKQGSGNGNSVCAGGGHNHANGNENQSAVQLNVKKMTNGVHNSNGSTNEEAKDEDLPMAVRVFRFTKEQLATLKRMAVEEKADVTFSSYEMLSGHIWKCITQARKLAESQETKLFVATDGRSRLNPPLPKGYFGNVIFTCTPIATAGELVSNPITYAARKVSITHSIPVMFWFLERMHLVAQFDRNPCLRIIVCHRFMTRWRE